MCSQQHLGGQLKFSLNTSNGAIFFCGVSEFRFNISISALLFFVPNKSETMPTSAAVLCFIGLGWFRN
jgi:hypothetical protein